MARIKIISNPYDKSLSYSLFREQTQSWDAIGQDSINSKLRETDEEKFFLPFNIKEIIDTIIKEYYTGEGKVTLEFQGTADEFAEAENICSDEEICDKIDLVKSKYYLENARDILDQAKEIFDTVRPIIKNIVKDDPNISKGLEKVSDALKDIIPICIFGNYSAGKSTFINSLIGYEILPSGGDPVTSKIYEIKRSSQPDRARISFAYREERFEMFFDDKECHIQIGNKDADIIQEILTAISELEEKSLFAMVNNTIEILNSYEKRDKTDIVISNVIKIELPFCENGILGRSHNEFVIFDTPGSNSNSNIDHEQVLASSLEGFSNGIPVWVSGYDSIDSTDNAHLCDMLSKIEALDKRFTMIVVNKADSTELPKNGFKSDDITAIMEYESVNKMYSSGIYFVSSVMGLGAKNIDGIISDYLLDVFDEKEKKFSDPNARAYKKLYEYNIMPAQMKQHAVEYSLACDNIIYANSGLYCVEMEMEQFASRHAAYNKYQMVYTFLKSIIDETARRINEKTGILEKNKKKLEDDLNSKERDLIGRIDKETYAAFMRYKHDSVETIQAFIKNNLNYESNVDTLDEKINKFTNEGEKETGYDSYEDDLDKAKSNFWGKFAENGQKLFKGNISDVIGNIKNLAGDIANESREVHQRKEMMDSARKEIDKKAADGLMNEVVGWYKRNFVDAQNRLTDTTRGFWQLKAKEYQDAMMHLILDSDAINEQQRSELSAVIMNFEPICFNDDADMIFIKARFLQGNFLGIQLVDSERLNTRSLVRAYNSNIKKNINEMSRMINDSYTTSFEDWQKKLHDAIEANITTYNPELRELVEIIKEESERISELQMNQQTISNSFRSIEDMMSWKEIE